MKKTVLIFCLVAVCLCSHSVFAQEEGKFGVGIRVSLQSIADDSTKGVDLGFDTTTRYGGNLSYFFTKRFALDLSVEYSQLAVEESLGGITNNFGELTQIPILLTARFYPPRIEMVNPFVGIGGGYYINSLDYDAVSSSAFNQVTGVEFDNNWGFHLNGGISFNLSQNTTFDIDLKYCWSIPDVKFAYADGSVEKTEVDLDTFVGGVGVTFHF